LGALSQVEVEVDVEVDVGAGVRLWGEPPGCWFE
jgi:hypothetical protein